MQPSSAHLMNGREIVYRETDRKVSSPGSSEAGVPLTFTKVFQCHISGLESLLIPSGLKILWEKNRDSHDIIGSIRSPNQASGELLPRFHSHGAITALSSHRCLLGGSVSSYFQLKQRRDIKGPISKPETPTVVSQSCPPITRPPSPNSAFHNVHEIQCQHTNGLSLSTKDKGKAFLHPLSYLISINLPKHWIKPNWNPLLCSQPRKNLKLLFIPLMLSTAKSQSTDFPLESRALTLRLRLNEKGLFSWASVSLQVR